MFIIICIEPKSLDFGVEINFQNSKYAFTITCFCLLFHLVVGGGVWYYHPKNGSNDENLRPKFAKILLFNHLNGAIIQILSGKCVLPIGFLRYFRFYTKNLTKWINMTVDTFTSPVFIVKKSIGTGTDTVPSHKKFVKCHRVAQSWKCGRNTD